MAGFDPLIEGFWAAVRDVWPETTPQRDWCHKMANVLDKLPKRLQRRSRHQAGIRPCSCAVAEQYVEKLGLLAK